MFVVVIGIVLGVEVVVVVVQSWREGVGGCSNTQICCVEVVVVWQCRIRLSGGGGRVAQRSGEQGSRLAAVNWFSLSQSVTQLSLVCKKYF